MLLILLFYLEAFAPALAAASTCSFAPDAIPLYPRALASSLALDAFALGDLAT
ncbi:MAG: hypothetical protein ACKPE1_02435 [Dolichospermum sp.]